MSVAELPDHGEDRAAQGASRATSFLVLVIKIGHRTDVYRAR